MYIIQLPSAKYYEDFQITYDLLTKKKENTDWERRSYKKFWQDSIANHESRKNFEYCWINF